jgi:hypothetical protein
LLFIIEILKIIYIAHLLPKILMLTFFRTFVVMPTDNWYWLIPVEHSLTSTVSVICSLSHVDTRWSFAFLSGESSSPSSLFRLTLESAVLCGDVMSILLLFIIEILKIIYIAHLLPKILMLTFFRTFNASNLRPVSMFLPGQSVTVHFIFIKLLFSDYMS